MCAHAKDGSSSISLCAWSTPDIRELAALFAVSLTAFACWLDEINLVCGTNALRYLRSKTVGGIAASSGISRRSDVQLPESLRTVPRLTRSLQRAQRTSCRVRAGPSASQAKGSTVG